MRYSPHTLYKKVIPTVVLDEFDNPIGNPTVTYEFIGKCRCDDNSYKEFTTENGTVYRPAYHIVAENVSLKTGDEIKCMDGDTLRGEGKIFNIKHLNFLNYTEIWV